MHTRPDMAYTVNLLSRFNTRPTYVACQAALHTLVYLDNSVEHGIKFSNLTDEEPLRAYSDADWKKTCICLLLEALIFQKGYCLKILKSLYGLKQAPRNWHNMLNDSMRSMGYQQCALDQCLFVHKGAGN